MRVAFLVAALLVASSPAAVLAQYGETARPLPVPVSSFTFGSPAQTVLSTAVQIGRRLFVAGSFDAIAPSVTGAAILDAAGRIVPGAFPHVSGGVNDVAGDGLGGWVIVGDFTSVGGAAVSRVARITPQRTLDPRVRIVANGPVTRVVVAHGRIYLAGGFSTVNGLPRRGLAALDAATGQLSPWAASFDSGGRIFTAMSASSRGVYLAAYLPGANPPSPRLWGLDAATGVRLFTRNVFASSLAASSIRVYVGTGGFERPLYAIDPLTGADSDWTLAARFVPFQSTIGDYTNVATMLLEGSRLYIGGSIRETGGRSALMAVDTDSATLTSFRWATPPSSVGRLARVGPALLATGVGPLQALDPVTGAQLPFTVPSTALVAGLVAAPEGVLVAGSMLTGRGVSREGIAAIDLDSGEVAPWTASLGLQPFQSIRQLATDGTWLFAATAARVFKIDAVTGAVAADLPVTGFLTRIHRHGDALIASWFESGGAATRVAVIDIATWTVTPLSTLLGGFAVGVSDIAADGDVVYVAGAFTSVDGQPRKGLAAFRRTTGQLLPWAPQVDDGLRQTEIEAAAGRVWVAGNFRSIGGARRRGLAQLDPVTGAALAWNPDVPGVLATFDQSSDDSVYNLRLGPDGRLYAQVGNDFIVGRPTAAGQQSSLVISYDITTGRRVPWRHDESGLVDVVADCVLVGRGCMPRLPAPPSALQVTQASGETRLAWTPSAAPGVTGVRLELGSREGAADLGALDFSPTTHDVHAPVPPGRYVARVRSLVGGLAGPPSPDVSFAVGAPAAPLDVTATVDGTRVTFNWLPPSTGAPAGYVLEAGSREDLADLGAVPLPGSATTFSAVVPPLRYWARLRAVDARGRSAPSGELQLAMEPSDTCAIEPRAPLALSAAVTGSTVTFRWQLDATGTPPDGLRLLAGITPGGSDVTLDLAVGASSYSVAAPPGTYYARLVATNACGTSPATATVTVVVP